MFGVNILKYLNNTSIVLHSAGVFSIAVAVVAAAPTHRSAKEVFATFYDGTGVDGHEGWSERASPAYVAICGILLSQYTITGFDASAHLSEETRTYSLCQSTAFAEAATLTEFFCGIYSALYLIVG